MQVRSASYPGHDALHDFLDSREAKLEEDIVAFWLAKASELDSSRLGLVLSNRMLSVVDRQQVREDVASFLLEVLLPAWVDAYTSIGAENHARYTSERLRAAHELWTRDTIRGLEAAAGILSAARGENADPELIVACYGLTEVDAVALARYDAQLVSKSVARRSMQYARQLLRTRAQRIAKYEVAHARSAGEEEAAHHVFGRGNFVKVWRTDPRSNVCERCARMEGEEVDPGRVFSEGVDSTPLHGGCRCWIERRSRTF